MNNSDYNINLNPSEVVPYLSNQTSFRQDRNPFRSVQNIAHDVLPYENPLSKLDTFRGVLSQSNYAQTTLATFPTLTPQVTRSTNFIEDFAVNPAVVQQLRKSISEGKPTSSFLPGAKNSTTQRQEMNVIDPATAKALQLINQYEGSAVAQEKYARYYSRPGVRDYTNLIKTGGGIKGIFFQFQSQELIAALFKPGQSFEIMTQSLDKKAFDDANRTKINILAGNELFMAVGNNAPDNVNRHVYGIQSDSSFHPKIGYIPDKSGGSNLTYRLAFIGSQNITPALDGGRTIESLLVLNPHSSIEVEKKASQEIATYTDSLFTQSQAGVSQAERLTFPTDRKFLYLQGGQNNLTEVKDLYYDLINKASDSKSDRLVLSMSEFTANGLSDSIGGAKAKASLLDLASKGRLLITLDSETLNKALRGDEETKSLYKQLADKGALKIVPTQFLHDKSISIFDKDNKLIAYTIGSANFSYYALSGKNNTETVLAFRSGSYAKDSDPSDVLSYLETIQGDSDSEFMSHVQFLTGQDFQKDKSLYLRGYKAERPSRLPSEEQTRIQKIEALYSALTKHNASAQTGTGKIDIQYRYNPERSQGKINALSPVGLTINIQSPEGIHKLGMDLTITKEGNVIVSDLNKSLNTSKWVNLTSEPMTLFKGALNTGEVRERTIAPGESTTLSSIETAIAMVNSIQREMVYQSEYVQSSIYFKRLVNESKSDALRIGKQILAEQFGKTLDLTKSSSLPSILQGLSKSKTDKDNLNRLIIQTVTELVGTESTPLLTKVFKSLNETLIAPLTPDRAVALANQVSSSLLEVILADGADEGNLLGLSKAFILRHEPTAQAYRRMAKTQSRTLLSQILSPFAYTHELNGDSQGRSRMPVFGESDSDYPDALKPYISLGLLNPLEYNHADIIGEPGSTWRSLSSASRGKVMKLPFIGGIRQLTISDASLNEGAGIVHDYDILARSTTQLIKLNSQDYIQSLTKILREVGKVKVSNLQKLPTLQKIFKPKHLKASDEEFQDISLLFSPFVGAERLTQRIKSIVGSKASLDVSSSWLSHRMSTIIQDPAFLAYYGLQAPTSKASSSAFDHILSGKLRTSLSPLQLDRVRQARQELAKSLGVDVAKITYRQVEAYFREEALDVTNTVRGIIGPEENRRVALSMGANLLSDPIYLNAGYKPTVGKISRIRQKINVGNLENPIAQQHKLAWIFGQEGIITSQSFTQDGKTYEPGYYIKNPKGGIEQVASYVDDGYLAFKDIYEITQTPFGRRRTSLLMKSPAFAQRATGGITFTLGLPSIATTQRGVNIYEIDALTVNRVETGHRPSSSDGLVKGPFTVLTESFFSQGIDANTYERGFASAPEKQRFTNLMSVAGSTTYAFLSPNNIKGLPTKGLVSMLAAEIDPKLQDQNSFMELFRQSDLDVAKSLSLLFLGDKEIRQALASHYKDDYIKRFSILSPDKIDVTKKGTYSSNEATVSNLALIAPGLLGLQDIKSSSEDEFFMLKDLKKLVLTALGTGAEANQARQTLKERTQRLLVSARQSGETYGSAMRLTGKTGEKFKINPIVQLSDHDGTVKAGALYAMLVLAKSQLLGEVNVAAKQRTNTLNLNELPLNLTSFYHGFSVSKDIQTGEIKVTPDSTSKGGYTATQYQNVLGLVQGELGADLHNLDRFKSHINFKTGEVAPEVAPELYELYSSNEFLLNALELTVGKGPIMYMPMDLTVSDSLTPAGMKDSVQFEASSYVNLSSQRLRMFRDQMSLGDNPEALDIQSSYFMMLGLLNQGVYSTSRAQERARATFKLPFVGYATGLNLLPPNTDLVREGHNVFVSPDELDMLSIASLYKKDVKGMSSLTQQAILDAMRIQELQTAKTSKTITSLTEYVMLLGSQDLTADHLTTASGDWFHPIGINAYLQARPPVGRHGSIERDYLAGVVAVEESLLKQLTSAEGAERKNILRLYQSIHTSKNIIIPNLNVSSSSNQAGLWSATVQAMSPDSQPALGVLLGGDTIGQLGTIFGDFTSEVLGTQLSLVQTLIEAQPLLAKIGRGGELLLNTTEKILYDSLQTKARESWKTLSSLLTSQATRQAYGDHESFQGGVGIPVNTHLLNPWEMVVGDRFLRLAGQTEPALGTIITKMTHNVSEHRMSETDYRVLSHIINTYTVGLTEVEGKVNPHTLNPSQVKELLRYDPNTIDSPVKLEKAYQALLQRKLGDDFSPYDSTTVTKAALPNHKLDRQLLTEAKIYNQIIDLGLGIGTASNEQAILSSLMEDTLNLSDLASIPKSWSEASLSSSLANPLNSTNRVARLAQLGLGAMSSRTGHPSASAASISENDNYILQDPNIIKTRQDALYEDNNPRLSPDPNRMTPGMIVPSISRFISMLGDYDGDSHRIITNKSHILLEEYERSLQASTRLKTQIKAVATQAIRLFVDTGKLDFKTSLLELKKHTKLEKMLKGMVRDRPTTVPLAKLKKELDTLKSLRDINDALSSKYLQVNPRIPNQGNVKLVNRIVNPIEAKQLEQLNLSNRKDPNLQRELTILQTYEKGKLNLLDYLSNTYEIYDARRESKTVLKGQALKDQILLFNYQKLIYEGLMTSSTPDEIKALSPIGAVLYEQRENLYTSLEGHLQSKGFSSVHDITEKLQDSIAPLLTTDEEDPTSLALISRLEQLEKSKRVAESRKLSDITDFIHLYTGLPEFITKAKEAPVGKMLSYIAQKFSMDGISDHAPNSMERVARTGLMSYLVSTQSSLKDMIDNFQNLSAMPHEAKLEYLAGIYIKLDSDLSQGKGKAFGLNEASLETANFEALGGAEDEDTKLLEGLGENLTMLGQALPILLGDENNTDSAVRAVQQLYGQAYGYSTALGLVNTGMLKKATGEFLDPFEFEASIRTIGEGGSKLIGEAYNTLIPLLDQQMLLAPFASGSTGQAELFRSYIQDLTEQKNRANPTDQASYDAQIQSITKVAQKLGVKLSSEDSPESLRAQRNILKGRLYGTVGFLTNFQQGIRDALKPPKGRSDASILNLFAKETFFKEDFTPTSLLSILGWQDDTLTPRKQTERRESALRQFLGLTLGTDTSTGFLKGSPDSSTLNPAQQAWFKSVEGRNWTNGVTGFGVLMMLKDFTSIEEGKFHSTFIGANSDPLYGEMQEEFKSWMSKGQAGDAVMYDQESLARAFVKTRIIDLMQRSQAAFSTESLIKGGTFKATELVDAALLAYQSDPLSAETTAYHDLLSPYEEKVKTEGASSTLNPKQRKLREAENRDLLQNIIYRKLQLENAEYSSLTGDSLEYLRTTRQDLKAIETTQAEHGLSMTQAMSVNSINNTILRLRRGKVQSILEATDIGAFNLHTLNDILTRSGFSLEAIQNGGVSLDKEQKVAASMLIGLVGQLGLESQEQTSLVQMLVSRDPKGNLRLGQLAEDTAYLSQAQRIIEESGRNEVRPGEDLSTRTSQLNSILDSILGGNYESKQTKAETILSIKSLEITNTPDTIMSSSDVTKNTSTTSLSGGADTLSGGVDTLSRGADTLSGGVDTLSRGVDTLSGGVDTLSRGVDTLSGGVDTLSRGVDTLSGETNTLSRRVDTLSGGVDTLSGETNTLSRGVNTLSGRADTPQTSPPPLSGDVSTPQVDIDSSVIDTSTLAEVLTQTSLIDDQIQVLETAKNQIIAEVTADNEAFHQQRSKAKTGQLRAMYGAEVAGILVSPLIFALVGNKDIEPTERLLTFGVDALQGLAETSAGATSYTREYLGNQSNQARGFSFARLRQSLGTEGLGGGIIQGLGQELMFKGISGASQGLVANTLGRLTHLNPNIQTVGFSVLGEIAGAVLGQTIARSFMQVRGTKESAPTLNPILQILDNFLTQAWQISEATQLETLDSDYQVLDTDNNTEIDFELSANLPELWWDIESGLTITDSSGQALDTEDSGMEVNDFG